MPRKCCPDCDGPKVDVFGDLGDGRCSRCHGTGKTIGDAFYETFGAESPCWQCGGSGVCPRCRKSGEIEIADSVDGKESFFDSKPIRVNELRAEEDFESEAQESVPETDTEEGENNHGSDRGYSTYDGGYHRDEERKRKDSGRERRERGRGRRTYSRYNYGYSGGSGSSHFKTDWTEIFAALFWLGLTAAPFIYVAYFLVTLKARLPPYQPTVLPTITTGATPGEPGATFYTPDFPRGNIKLLVSDSMNGAYPGALIVVLNHSPGIRQKIYIAVLWDGPPPDVGKQARLELSHQQQTLFTETVRLEPNSGGALIFWESDWAEGAYVVRASAEGQTEKRYVFHVRHEASAIASRPSLPSAALEFNEAVLQAGMNGVGFPQCISCPGPIYADEARRAKLQGVVVLEIVVTPEGRAANIRVVRGPGMGLEERAIEAVSRWRFTPAADSNGVPVAVRVPIEVTFKLY